MIIRKLNASFGALDGRRMELRDGLNIITAPNESGKSTWCAFLATMLYGLDTSARAKQGAQPDRLRYAPWSGAPMAGSMELEHEGQSITLRRWTERPNAPMQAFSATWTGTDDPVPALTADNAGETLTGVQRDVFERSAFIRQAGMSVQGGAALEKRISAIVSSGEEDVSYSETDRRLRQWQRHRKSGSRGAIPETERVLAETEEKLRAGRECAERAAEIDGKLERLRTERAGAVRRMEQARAAQRRRALDELFQSRQRLRALEQERAEAAEASGKAHAGLRAGVFGEKSPEQAREQAEATAKAAEDKLETAAADVAKERDGLKLELQEARRKLEMSDVTVAQFKIVFDTVQGNLNDMLALIAKASGENQTKLRAAAEKLIDAFKGRIES